MLKVSENRRFLVKEDNSPFFYLGDTGWALLQRLDRDETDLYLRDRASKGYTVIQVMGISEFDGLTVPNRYGDVPFEDLDPTRPTEGYFEHVDWVVDRAAELGLHIGLLPTWGDKVGPLQWGTGPEVFTPENAAVYGEFLGERYRDKPIIWVIGGDRNPTEPRHYATWRAMAEGVKRGDGGRHLMTFHPQGGSSSSAFFHDDPWLSFNMLQSGHARRNGANYEMIHQDYTRTPTKPCLDGEPCYEDHPVNWKPEGGYFAAYDVRKAAYWALFAGAHGHTYGCNGVFQFWKSGQEDRFGVLRPWQEAIELPGAAQMQHARRLMESRPFLQRIPNQGLLASDPGKGHCLYRRHPLGRRQLRLCVHRLRPAVHGTPGSALGSRSDRVLVRPPTGHGGAHRRVRVARGPGVRPAVEWPGQRLGARARRRGAGVPGAREQCRGVRLHGKSGGVLPTSS